MVNALWSGMTEITVLDALDGYIDTVLDSALGRHLADYVNCTMIDCQKSMLWVHYFYEIVSGNYLFHKG